MKLFTFLLGFSLIFTRFYQIGLLLLFIEFLVETNEYFLDLNKNK